MAPHRKGKAPPSTPHYHRAVVRQLTALELRTAGVSYSEISERLGITVDTARATVRRALAELEKLSDEQAAELRRIELERLDILQASLWPAARDGDVKAAAQCAAIIAQRAEMLGIDKPAGEVGVAVAPGITAAESRGMVPPSPEDDETHDDDDNSKQEE